MTIDKSIFGLRTIAATAIFGTALLFAAPSFADDTATSTQTAPATTPAPAKGSQHRRNDVEAQITYLHQQLGITAAQETQWTAVAQTMRDNEKTIRDLVKDRRAKGGNMTAVDDLQSYEAIAEAHADGIKKLIPAFQALYNSLSDDQKKTADALFRHARHATAPQKTP